MKTHTLEELTDKYIGKIGTPKRDAFENELRLDLIGHAIKEARKERNLTQEQLGELVGVKKAQISKIENNATENIININENFIQYMKENFGLNGIFLYYMAWGIDDREVISSYEEEGCYSVFFFGIWTCIETSILFLQP